MNFFVTPYDIPGERKKREQPIDLIKKRYASGEIDKEEFEKMKKILPS
ncbi:putative membrane protein [Chryseobacterium ginsenosidimutans]|nr:SHOCT domain-containing protein [Chryseobacterium ginsenosidimutans]MDQ0594996.1 putative membrane protein [Chryseobacterium ginsenosidimutans]